MDLEKLVSDFIKACETHPEAFQYSSVDFGIWLGHNGYKINGGSPSDYILETYDVDTCSIYTYMDRNSHKMTITYEGPQ